MATAMDAGIRISGGVASEYWISSHLELSKVPRSVEIATLKGGQQANLFLIWDKCSSIPSIV